MKRILSIAALAALALSVAIPGAAQAQTCAIGDNGVTSNRGGVPAKFTHLDARQGMNCASARYVLNKWLRPAYAKTYSYGLPARFYDGYVTWYCGKVSYLRWSCEEYDSGTSFRFTAYRK
jgi:hypothetical protein